MKLSSATTRTSLVKVGLQSNVYVILFKYKYNCLVKVKKYIERKQEWARDVKDRDRDETETRPRRSPPETETLASPTETRPRRDVKISRRDGKVEVLLTAITGLGVIFHVHCL